MFMPSLSFDVYFGGNGTDLSLSWVPSSSLFHGTAALLSLCPTLGPCQPSRLVVPRDGQTVVKDMVPASTKNLFNLSVAIVNTTTNASVAGPSAKSLYVFGMVGQATLAARFNASSGHQDRLFQTSLYSTDLNYTCQWTATVGDAALTVTAPLRLESVQYDIWGCAVPEFDTRLPAGTNFTMAVMSASGPVAPRSPVVMATGSVATDMRLPEKLCSGENVTVEGFFSMPHLYLCSFGPASGSSQRMRPLSPNLIVCPLPNFPSTVDSVTVWENTPSAMRAVHTFNKGFTIEETCDSSGGDGSDDPLPYWAWILIGLGAVAALALVLGTGMMWYKRQARAGYEHLGTATDRRSSILN